MKRYSYKKIIDFISRHKESADKIRVGMNEDWSWTACEVWNSHGFKIYASKEEATKLEDSHAPHRIDEDGVIIAGIDLSRWATPTAIAYKDGKKIASEEVSEEVYE